MERYNQLYRLYEEFDTTRLRQYQEFVDLFPPVDSPVALEHWQRANDELDAMKGAVAAAYPEADSQFATIASLATREQTFTALDLHSKYGRGVNVLVLDVDETLRSAGRTDNEIPREVLYLLTRFHEADIPIVICTGQTLENVKGFLIQGLGNELVHSGAVSVVYEAGTGVFTPGHGAATKQLLYEDLATEVRSAFRELQSRIFSEAPTVIREGCHLQGNEFNVTLKPNFETGSDSARSVIDEGLCYLLDLLGNVVARVVDIETDAGTWARRYYAASDPEIRAVLEATDRLPADESGAIPDSMAALFDRIDVAYYEADAAEVTSRELNKVAGVKAALDVLGIDDPHALVMGDSKSDLRVMEWARAENAGIAAAPEHASPDVLEHVCSTDDLVFDPGDAGELLRTAFALNCIAELP